MSMPVLPLPMTITHAINEWSPLYGVTEEKLRESNVEIIAVLDGTDEFAANTCQVSSTIDKVLTKKGSVFLECRKHKMES